MKFIRNLLLLSSLTLSAYGATNRLAYLYQVQAVQAQTVAVSNQVLEAVDMVEALPAYGITLNDIAAWNAKPTHEDVTNIANAVLSPHAGDTNFHVRTGERELWTGKPSYVAVTGIVDAVVNQLPVPGPEDRIQTIDGNHFAVIDTQDNVKLYVVVTNYDTSVINAFFQSIVANNGDRYDTYGGTTATYYPDAGYFIDFMVGWTMEGTVGSTATLTAPDLSTWTGPCPGVLTGSADGSVYLTHPVSSVSTNYVKTLASLAELSNLVSLATAPKLDRENGTVTNLTLTGTSTYNGTDLASLGISGPSVTNIVTTLAPTNNPRWTGVATLNSAVVVTNNFAGPLIVRASNGIGLVVSGTGKAGGTDDAGGAAIGISYNATGNKQLWFGDTRLGNGARFNNGQIDGWNFGASQPYQLTLGSETVQTKINGSTVITAINTTNRVVVSATSVAISNSLFVAGNITATGDAIYTNGTLQVKSITMYDYGTSAYRVGTLTNGVIYWQ